ncbi:MAG: L-threonine 3-dehydrogenase [Bacillota bacterium]|jgi:threonine 3-dehydrogenase|nr:MAG: L-threonine 3-dehydrogenase [Bacillota bacterium]
MRALVKTAPGAGAELQVVPVPRPGPGEVLVKVAVASICGTDVHIYEWNAWAAGRMRTPIVFGHEFAGHVVALGTGASGVEVGDYVSAESHVICGRCYQCRTGQSHICRSCSILGVDRQGCFADYVVVPAANVWHNPPELAPEVASIQEPFGNAVDTVFADGVPGKSFLVLGCGPIGLMAVALLRASGATPIIAADLSDYRLAMAMNLGADHVIDAKSADTVSRTLELTGGEGVDAVLEMSGARTAITQALKAARNGGRVTMLGLPAGPVALDLAEDFVFKGLTLQGITGRHIFETWYTAKAFLASGRVDLRPVITHSYPIEVFREAFELAITGKCGKIVLTL